MAWTILKGLAALLSVTTGSAGNRQRNLKGLTSSGLSSVTSQGESVGNHPANEVEKPLNLRFLLQRYNKILK